MDSRSGAKPSMAGALTVILYTHKPTKASVLVSLLIIFFVNLTFFTFFIFPVYDDSIQVRIVAGSTVAVVFILVLVIVVTVLFLRSKNHDDMDKKTNNHLPLPVDYASNEGNFKKIVQKYSSFSFFCENVIQSYLHFEPFHLICFCFSKFYARNDFF